MLGTHLSDLSRLGEHGAGVDRFYAHLTDRADVEHLPLTKGLRELCLTRSELRCGLSEVVARAPHLNRLSLAHCFWATELSPLSDLRLEALFLAGLDTVTNLGFLTDQPELRTLSANYTPVRDLGPVAYLSNLKYLHLGGCVRITDLSPLASLTGLRLLQLRDTRAGLDLAPLTGLRNLTIYIRSGQDVSNRAGFPGKIVETA